MNAYHRSRPMTAPDDVRARFEAWVVEQPWFSACLGLTMVHDAYVDPCINSRWQGYRAAHADLAGEVRELVEAARYAMNNIHMVDGTAMDAVVGPTFTVYGMFLNKLHAALAKFHPTQRATNYVSGYVDDAGKFHPTHQEKP